MPNGFDRLVGFKLLCGVSPMAPQSLHMVSKCGQLSFVLLVFMGDFPTGGWHVPTKCMVHPDAFPCSLLMPLRHSASLKRSQFRFGCLKPSLGRVPLSMPACVELEPKPYLPRLEGSTCEWGWLSLAPAFVTGGWGSWWWPMSDCGSPPTMGSCKPYRLWWSPLGCRSRHRWLFVACWH